MLDLKLAPRVGINEALGGAVYLRVDGLWQLVHIEQFISFLVDVSLERCNSSTLVVIEKEQVSGRQALRYDLPFSPGSRRHRHGPTSSERPRFSNVLTYERVS